MVVDEHAGELRSREQAIDPDGTPTEIEVGDIKTTFSTIRFNSDAKSHRNTRAALSAGVIRVRDDPDLGRRYGQHQARFRCQGDRPTAVRPPPVSNRSVVDFRQTLFCAIELHKPGDACQLGEGFCSCSLPGSRLDLERAREPRVMGGPGHMREDNTMLLAVHAQRVGLEVRERGPKIDRSPASASLSKFLPRAGPAAHAAATLFSRYFGTDITIEPSMHILNHGALDPSSIFHTLLEHTPPWPSCWFLT